jgi:hypothetical protein
VILSLDGCVKASMDSFREQQRIQGGDAQTGASIWAGRLAATVVGDAAGARTLRRFGQTPGWNVNKKREKVRGEVFGSPAWIRTTIKITHVESVSYRKSRSVLLMSLTHFSSLVQNLYAATRRAPRFASIE